MRLRNWTLATLTALFICNLVSADSISKVMEELRDGLKIWAKTSNYEKDEGFKNLLGGLKSPPENEEDYREVIRLYFQLRGRVKDLKKIADERFIRLARLCDERDGQRGKYVEIYDWQYVNKNNVNLPIPAAALGQLQKFQNKKEEAEKPSDACPPEARAESSSGRSKSFIKAGEGTTLFTKYVFTPGSAFATSGWKKFNYIIHAASGSHGFSRMLLGGTYDPSVQSVAKSVENSLILANRLGVQAIAIPLIGGAIFMDRIREKAPEVDRKYLATLICNIIKKHSGNLKEIVLFSKGLDDVEAFKAALAEGKFDQVGPPKIVVQEESLDSLSFSSKFEKTAIVNAANVQADLDAGGLAGAIYKQLSIQEREKIEAETLEIRSQAQRQK